MGLRSRSAARARLAFNAGITRGEAWQSLSDMFRTGDSEFTISSLVPGSYSLRKVAQGHHTSDIGIGDLFQYNRNSVDVAVSIISWKPGESLGYQETWKFYSNAPDSRATTELKIVDDPDGLALEIRHVCDLSPGLFLMAWDRIVNSKGRAFGILDSLIGPSSEHASAWAGSWKKLPTRNAMVMPAKFDEPSILQP